MNHTTTIIALNAMNAPFASASAAQQKKYPLLRNALKLNLQQFIAAPPQNPNALCKNLEIDYKQLWQRAQVEFDAVPGDVVDFINGLALIRFLALNPSQKVFGLMHRLDFHSESAFCKFCKRVFSALPSRIKQEPQAAFIALKENYPSLAPLIVEKDIFPNAAPAVRKAAKALKKTEEE